LFADLGAPEADDAGSVALAMLSRAVQSGARRDGIAGIYGNPGIVESVTYRF
jgi:hypothetical protein